MPDVVRSMVIIHDQSLCTACGICELICSLYHEGLQGPELARSHIVRQPFTANHSRITCQQCSSPDCYLACPLKDRAICVDLDTGIVYINEDECTSCGMCIDACPFEPPRIKINREKNVAFKCDLCRERDGGPICVEYCPFQTLKVASNGRGEING